MADRSKPAGKTRTRSPNRTPREKPPPDPTKLKREAAGRYVSGDGRFTVEQGSGGWMVLDADQTNEFGLPLARGPFAGLDAARAAMETARAGPAPTSTLTAKIARLPPKRAGGTDEASGTKRAASKRESERAQASTGAPGPGTELAPEPEPAPPTPVEIREYRSGDGPALRALWAGVGFDSPGDDDASLRRFAQRNAGTFLVAVQGTTIVASAMGGWDGRRGWIYHVATAPDHRRAGHARALVRRIEERFRATGSPRANTIVSDGNEDGAAFWESLGYVDRPARQFGKDLGES